MDKKEINLLEVKFSSDSNKKIHYKKHVMSNSDNANARMPKMSEEEYADIADKLSDAKAGNIDSKDRIIGYVTKDGRKVKYDKETEFLVVYTSNGVISLYKRPLERFMRKLTTEYVSDLPENQKNLEDYTIQELEEELYFAQIDHDDHGDHNEDLIEALQTELTKKLGKKYHEI